MSYEKLYEGLPKPPEKKKTDDGPLELHYEVTDVKELAKLFSAGATRTLYQIALSGVSEAARVAASNAILDRAHGKAAQSITHKGDSENPIALTRIDDLKNQILRAIPTDELNRLLSLAKPIGFIEGTITPDIQQD